MLHDIETKAALVARRAQVRFLKASDHARELVHRRPLTAVLTGLGAGCFIGLIGGLVVGKSAKKDDRAAELDDGMKCYRILRKIN